MPNEVRIDSLADVTRGHAMTIGERIALVCEGRETTFAELDRRASRVANGLIAAGIGPQARIGYLDRNSDRFFEVLFGAAKANDVMVAVNWRLAPPEIAFVLNDARAEVLFVGKEFFPVLEDLLPGLKDVRKVIALDAPHSGWEEYGAWRDAQPETDPQIPVDLSDVAVQMYTSGTTGHPKGAQLTHENFLTLLPAATNEWGARWTIDDVNLVCMPLFHIAGSGWGVLGLYAGARSVVVRDIIPTEILKVIPEHRITRAIFVPAVLLFLVQTPGAQETDFSSLNLIAYGASPIPLDLLRAAIATFKCDFAQVYGLTETTGAVTYLPPEDHDPDGNARMRSCGRPMGGITVRVVDGNGRDLPPGEVGEIIVKTKQNMKGYWNLPDETAKAMKGDWFYTGDAGYLDSDGYLYIHDRVKDMIVSGGENVYPAEVESALFGHPGIADVAVIGVPDDKWGEAVKAIVVLKPGAEADAAGIIAFARERIAAYKAPRSVDFVEALPRNPSGKILKRELRDPYWHGRARQVN
ncbi:fatty acid--CoA ligase [Candidatus Amarobacter glycogenicus]|uniref:fatty acid--CoA ligase n=1 Tax=Candidatus Amarobacter glycogenicus TaxID=3140699 RepID=UPI002A16F996|nr:fatty acid--CoA ligase [Dehalococcoidia bacterium]